MTGTTRFATDWLTLPDLVEVLGEPLNRVRRLLDDRFLLGSRREGPFKVPAAFIVDGEPLNSLRGTFMVLLDSGFTEDEVIDWMLEPEESIGMPPLEALLAGRKSEVRRVARSQA